MLETDDRQKGECAYAEVVTGKGTERKCVPGQGNCDRKIPKWKVCGYRLFYHGTQREPTDTIYEQMDKQQTFEQALRTREFEPDAPNYTPRISGIMHVGNGEYNYAMSILKSNNGNPDSCSRYTFAYSNPAAGEGHFIHTYECDGEPLPSFEGEPRLVEMSDDMDAFTDMLWNSLNEDNKVSLFVRYIDIATGEYRSKIVNKNQ